jgi:hypothetical protein
MIFQKRTYELCNSYYLHRICLSASSLVFIIISSSSSLMITGEYLFNGERTISQRWILAAF